MKKGRHPLFTFFMTVVGFIFLVCMSTTLVIYLRPIYYVVIKAMDIPGKTGFSYEICKANYNVLIDYNTIFGPASLEFPDFIMSAAGRQHFAEVKTIFVVMQAAAFISLPVLIGGYFYGRRIKSYTWLKGVIVFTLLFAAAIGAMLAIDWDWTFTMMHKLLFNNDFWIFNPSFDPIIRVLPDTFFLVCAASILVLMVLGLVLAGVLYKKSGRKKKG